MDHTLRQQLAAQQAQLVLQNTKIDRLTELLEKTLTATTTTNTSGLASANTINGQVGQAAQTIQNTQVNITLRPWSSAEGQIYLPVSMLQAAFTENPKLIEYCGMEDSERVDAERAAPYVQEALVDLVKRAHAADPSSRNVYLNPRRSDQVLVYDEAWKVLTLVEAISALFDTVAGGINRIIFTDATRKQLTLGVQAAAAWVPSLYREEPEAYVKRAKPQMAAHLANTAPVSAAIGPAASARALARGPGRPAVVPAVRPAAQSPEEKRLTAEGAVYLLAQVQPKAATAEYLRQLAGAAGVPVDRVVQKLWEAGEDGLLGGEDSVLVGGLVALYDAAPGSSE